ncbi:hypothetical protein LZ575_20435 [Antarcticibacterium sp. 1MA-6-2]|uniref:hypothetical protein n=1 Tax=Antarcticibacterium sp. 1MA-6-2 TaxID=2908210 RepID=UPI001F15B900|nr:hypothetical protein [Antarcticibacterium sp. 1MA-6-2]UJH91013.1 hypothetical protein LZ575_20435 [Antarcticibacterium sp. 1MA-6-2]
MADVKTPSEVIKGNITSWAVAPNLEPEFPEIEAAIRVNEIEALVKKDDLKFLEEDVIAADLRFLYKL